jgi:SAM-dependent methyltransferase
MTRVGGGSAHTFRFMDTDGYFDRSVAERYDDPTDEMFSPELVGATVDFLIEESRGGDTLEFGIGTGRIAHPLSDRGVTVAGVDLSQAMLDQLTKKPGAASIAVTRGDFATTRVVGDFSLVYLVFNTIMNLTTQAEQVACVRNAAAHLVPGGRFVVEVMVPDLQRLPPGQTGVVFRSDGSGWGIDEYDVANQGLISHHLDIDGDDVRRVSVPFRYVWPGELDLMAELAGMRLVNRYGGWDRRPFDADSRQHVTVWEKPVG